MEGEMVCLLGRNGCGKSTLLRTLAGLQPALEGRVEPDLAALSAAERARYMALVLTERVSVDNTTVHDVVAMGRYLYTSFMGEIRTYDEHIITDSLLSVCSEGEKIDETRFFSSLSDGEKQRVLIAKALAQQTPIILLDEPTAHLDLPSRIQTMRLLQNLAHEQRKTILISTHELDLAIRYADRILLYGDSEIILSEPQKLLAVDAFTKAFGMKINIT